MGEAEEGLTAADEGHGETSAALAGVHCGVHAGPVIAIFVAIMSPFVRVFWFVLWICSLALIMAL
jgi:hypothetical protein